MPGILDNILVLDLTRNVAGPFATMTLGDLGARVIKIERPDTGDDTRHWRPPSWDDYSAIFLALNRNKQSLAIDLDDPEGRKVVRKLAEKADVILESFKPGSLDKRDLGYEAIKAVNPRVIYCSITGFGSKGPFRNRPGYDPIVQAYSGIMSITGEPGRPPVRCGPSVVDVGAGMWSVIGILAALYERELTGVGKRVETSLLETGLNWVNYHLAGYLGSGKVPGRVGSTAAMIAPYEAFATQDEYIVISAPNNALFKRLCDVLGLPDLPEDERFNSNPNRIVNRAALHEILEERLKTAPAKHWEEKLSAAGLPCSLVQTMDQVSQDPQVQALGMLKAYEHPRLNDFKLVDLPLSLDGRRSAQDLLPPELGEHSDAIMAELGYDEAEIAALREKGILR